MPGLKLIVGLGNPGRRYAETRHNVGWMALDRLADRAGLAGRGRERDAASTIRGDVAGITLVLAKPLTYMNDSGIAVRKLLARHQLPLEDMLVVVDDFALPFGRLRLRPTGSAGGHNGLASIIAELGSLAFARLRIGIGEPGPDAVDHVLSRFSAAERARLPTVLDAAADAIVDWARDGAPAAANRWNAWRLEGAAEGEGAASHPQPGEVGGPPGADGIRRTGTGWRRLLKLD